MRNPHAVAVVTGVAAFFAMTVLLLLRMSMRAELNHDEHQFISSGWLLSRHLLLPYRDYPYFHMPNLVLVYALLFKFSNHLLLSARLFSVACALITLGMIFYMAFTLFHRESILVRLLIAVTSVVFMLINPLFVWTSGKAWNHDASVLFAVSAFLLHCYGLTRNPAKGWLYMSGLALGLSIGTRLSFAFSAIPFIAIIPFRRTLSGHHRDDRVSLTAWFVFGLLSSMLPSFVVFALAPTQFIFGNVGYPPVSTAYFRETMPHALGMTFFGKCVFLKNLLMLNKTTLFLGLGFIYCVFKVVSAGLEKPRKHLLESTFTALLVPFLLVGAFAPTPPQKQYFYAPIPFMELGLLYSVASLAEQDTTRWRPKLLAGIAMAACMYSLPGYLRMKVSHSGWVTTMVHDVGNEIRATVGHVGPVLTLAPIFPLEGNVDVYEELATGPFAWRVGHLIPVSKRKPMKVVCERDLTEMLQARKPQAILVGFERDLEGSLETYALNNGYRVEQLSNGASLCLKK